MRRRHGLRVFSLGGRDGGSLEDPELLYHVDVPGVTIGHSAAFSGNGDVIIFGHEPGGGVTAACEATDPVLDRSFLFFDTDDGSLVGTWVLPRAQGPTENCTLHNYNVIPTKRRDLLVSGTTGRARESSTSPTRRRRSPSPGATRRPSRFQPERRSAAT